MRRRNQLVFDEVIIATSASPAFTPSKYDTLLAEFDQLAIFVLVDEVPVAVGFDLFIEHSADGQMWILKNASASPGDVHIATLSTTQTNVAWGSDPGALVNPPTPLLGHVRFRMYFSSAITAHVKVYVTQRDQGG